MPASMGMEGRGIVTSRVTLLNAELHKDLALTTQWTTIQSLLKYLSSFPKYRHTLRILLMSSREPLWYCHECHAEMRPLMVPDPVCASCHGSFVEKMENPADDPRSFANDDGDHNFGPGAAPPGVDNFLSAFLRSGPLEFQPPGSGGQDRATINGPLMAQYLMALLGHRDPAFFGIPENGRMGDYVFNQDALDQIITQIMENTNAHRPVPATDEIMAKLPREVLMEGSKTLELDCAVCKDQFKLGTEDPDEQVVVTLPCKHSFHEPCIMPWLRSSGTCPVCTNTTARATSTTEPGLSAKFSSAQRERGPSSPASSSSDRRPEQGGLFHSIFGGLTGHRDSRPHSSDPPDVPGSTSRSPPRSPPSSHPQSPPRDSSHRRSNSDPTRHRRNNGNGHGNHRDNFPGSWSEELD
ncbi:hypothetical protein NLJ89_g223 [Agrocybe chaxingu]|uniref:RING-type domain-containing protein n=1 Tax=Agrocybe chaxingu TaxID=84603 RepID=A0A9W8N2F9_9AGAR|nr:hypothetical protein NLJ89_g223 [Agrocybe chaxingu]